MSKKFPIAPAALLGLVLALSAHAADAPAAEKAAGKPPGSKQVADKAGNIEDAFAKADENSPGYEHEKRGDEYLEQRKFQEAIEAFDAALVQDPKAQTPYVKKGIALYRSARPAEAIPLMDKAIKLNRRGNVWEWWPLYNKGIAQGMSGDLQGAVKSFSASIKRKPNHENYFGRAMAYAQQQKLDESLADAQTALKHKPDDYRLSSFALHMEMNVKTRNESRAFLKKMAATEGAKKTSSGLIYFELKKGSGKRPTVDDSVKVHYHGTLIEGKVFDSSVERGEPVSLPLTKVIPCWTEGLQKMRVGGKARLICPAELAYGNRGVGSLIPPGAALVFEIELLGIE